MNDPTATDAVRADARKAYSILVENSYKAGWFDKTDTSDQKDAASVTGLKNALTYFDAVNAIRRANGVNELGVSLTAMATAMLNCSYSGQVTFNHSGIHTGCENLAMGDGPYTGSDDPDDWEDAYRNQDYYGSDWPFTGWYTMEKHYAEEHPNHSYSEIGHYLNFINPNVNSMGFGSGDGVTIWDGSYEESSYSVSDFRKIVDAYTKSLEDAETSASDVKTAQAAYDKAKTDYDQALKRLDQAREALEKARKATSSAQTRLDALSDGSALTDLKSTLDQAQAAYDKASGTYEHASQAYVSAVARHDAAIAEQKKAQAAYDTASQAYAPFKDRVDMLKTELDDARAALKDARNRADADSAAQKRLAKALEQVEAARKALDQANERYAAAVKASSEASANLDEKRHLLSEARDGLDKAMKALDAANEALKNTNGVSNTTDGDTATSIGLHAAPVRATTGRPATIVQSASKTTDKTRPSSGAAATADEQSGDLASTGASTASAAGLLAIMALVGTGCVFARHAWARE